MKRSLLVVGLGLSLGLVSSHTVDAQKTENVTAEKLPFRISKETTHVTEPLTETGIVDYTTYLNRELGKGVTPETNAAVLYWQAIGKSEEILNSPEFFERMKQALGTDPFASGGPYLVNLGKVAEAAGVEVDFNEGSTLGTQYNLAMERPWTSDEAPLIKQWLEQNAKPLEIVLEGTQRPHYYRPLVSASDNESMIALLLPDIQQHREISRMLKARAMLGIGENRPDEAIRDLTAIHRMARHTSQGSTLIEMLVGVALEAVAHQGDLQLANSTAASADQLTKYAKQLAELPPPVDMTRSYQTERFFGLDVIQRLATAQLSSEQDQGGMLEVLGLQAGSETMSRLMSVFFQYGVDWNQVLIGFNQYHDQVQAALELEQFAQRTAAMNSLTQEFRTEVQNVSTPANLALSIFATPEQRGKQMTTVLLGLLAPAIEQAHEAGTRGETKSNLSQAGIAVSAYQKANGEFPDSLAALVPKYLPELPNDPYTGNAFVYRIDSEGALIYSLGKNLKDDGGIEYDSELQNYDNHDHVFRVNTQNSK